MGYQYSTEQLYDNYTFKLLRRALMREFPYIKNVFVNFFDLGRYNTIFLNFDFDPAIWEQMYNDPMVKWLKDVTDEGGYIDLSYPTTGTNMEYDEYQPIKKSIEKVMSDVFNSEAVPKELKIQGQRPVAIGTWHVNRKGGKPNYTF